MSLADRDHANGWVCVDCLMLFANGETPIDQTEEETADYLARVDHKTRGTTVTLGRILGENGCDCESWDSDEHREGCEQQAFSWHACDTCGSHLGGSRDAVTFWFEPETTDQETDQ